MWATLQSSIRGRLQALQSIWGRQRVRVQEFTIHQPHASSSVGEWLARAGSIGFPSRPHLVEIDQRAERLLLADQTVEPQSRLAQESEAPLDHPREISRRVGYFLSALASRLDGPTIVETGAATGTIGMYLLSEIGQGHIWCFEQSEEWRDVAELNLSAVSSFYERLPLQFPVDFSSQQTKIGCIDLAILDGGQNFEEIVGQVATLLPHLSEQAVLIAVGVRRNDEILRAWRTVCDMQLVSWSCIVEDTLGVCEMKRSS